VNTAIGYVRVAARDGDEMAAQKETLPTDRFYGHGEHGQLSLAV
jgi:hypothetical protein